MADENETAKTALVFDASGAKKGADEFAASAQKVIAHNQAVGAATEAATQRVVTSLSSQTKFLDSLTRQYDPLGQAVRRAERDLERLNGIVAAGGDNAQRAAGMIMAATQRLQQAHDAADAVTGKPAAAVESALKRSYDASLVAGQAAREEYASRMRVADAYRASIAPIAGVAGATVEVAKGAALTKQQLQTLQYTLSDIVSSAGSGISPMTMLMQQGPQVAQAFSKASGGPGLLGAALMALRSPVGIAISGGLALVGSLTAVGLGYRSSVLEAKEFDKALTLSAGGMGRSSAELRELGNRIGAVQGLSKAAGREIVLAFAQEGSTRGGNLERATAMSRDFAAALGTEVPEGAKKLASSMADPARALTELGRQWHFLDLETLRYVEDLQAQGRLTEAQAILLDKIGPKIQGLATRDLSALGRAWRDVKDAASDAWGWMTRASEAPTPAQRVADAQARADALTNGPRNFGGKLNRARNEPGLQALSQTEVDSALQDERERARGRAMTSQWSESRDESIIAGKEIAKTYATESEELRKLTNDYVALTKAIANYQEQGKEVPEILQTAADRAGLRKSGFRFGTQERADQAAGLERVAGASPRDRSYVQAAVNRDEAVKAGIARGDSDAIEVATRRYAAEVRQLDQQLQQLSITSRETSAQTRLVARAFAQGDAEGMVAEAQRQAAIEGLTQRTDVAKRSLEILAERSTTAAVEGIQQARAAGIQADQAERLAAAAKLGAAAEQAVNDQIKVENAQRPLQASLKAALIASNEQETETTEAIRKAMEALDPAIKRVTDAEQARGLTIDRRQADDRLAVMRLELSLMGEGLTLRAQEVALLQERQRLMARGLTGEALERELELSKSRVKEEAKLGVELDLAKERERDARQAMNDFTRVIGTGLEDAILNGKKLKDVFAGLAKDIGQVIMRVGVTKPLQNMLAGWSEKQGIDKLLGNLFGGGKDKDGGGDWLSSLFGGAKNAGGGDWLSQLFGGGGGSAVGGFGDMGMGGMGMVMVANGGAFQGGRVTPFRNGGVVRRPTLFPMADGAGLMGEAGPEAVMPLRRLPGGRLGVEATGGGGGGGPTIVQHLAIDARGADASVDRRIRQAMAQTKRDTINTMKALNDRGGSFARNSGRRSTR